MRTQNISTTSDMARPKAAARHYGLSESFIRQWMMNRKIPSYKLGKAVFVKLSEIDAMIEKGRQ